MASDRVDPVYSYIDGEIARLRQLVEKLETDTLFSPDKVVTQDALSYLLRLIVEQRQMLTYVRINTMLNLMALQLSGTNEGRASEQKNREMQRISARFEGAIRETDDPVAVYNAWIAGLKTILVGQFDGLFRERDELPPLPTAFQD